MPVRDAPARWAAAPRHHVRMQELVSLSRRCITRAPHLSPRPATTQREPTPVAYCPEVWSLDVEPRCGVARVERSTMHCVVLSSGLREKKQRADDLLPRNDALSSHIGSQRTH